MPRPWLYTGRTPVHKHVHRHLFQEGLGQAIKTMRENAEAKAPPPEGTDQ
ncbi:MAG: hypothetical protein ACYDDR_07635 [Acidithiobacillus ferrivorans]